MEKTILIKIIISVHPGNGLGVRHQRFGVAAPPIGVVQPRHVALSALVQEPVKRAGIGGVRGGGRKADGVEPERVGVFADNGLEITIGFV